MPLGFQRGWKTEIVANAPLALIYGCVLVDFCTSPHFFLRVSTTVFVSVCSGKQEKSCLFGYARLCVSQGVYSVKRKISVLTSHLEHSGGISDFSGVDSYFLESAHFFRSRLASSQSWLESSYSKIMFSGFSERVGL